MIYIDIDGTLTSQDVRNGPPIMRRIEAVKNLCCADDVVIWSARGKDYAEAFCKRYGLEPIAALAKPSMCIDDKPTITGSGLRVEKPEILDT